MSIVNDSQFSDYLSRPVKLKTLTVKSIAKIFERNPSFFHQEAASLPRDLRQEIFNVIERRSNYKPSKNSSQDVFQAWQTFFCSDKLVLREFLGSHWSRQVFLHLVTSDTLHPDIRQLVLQSNEVNQERLCFLFELADCSWKPQLRSLLARLPQLTSVSLHDFCDDDTLVILGQGCPHLASLAISLGPESFSEQQLSDEGFSELLELQLGRATLREVDLGSCYSSTLTAKTLLSLSRVPGLETLHVMWDHFKWMDLSLRFLGADFRPSQSIRTLSIKFGFDNYENSTFFDISNGGINFIQRVFPEIQDFRVLNFSELGSQQEIDNLKSIFGDRIRVAHVKKCRDLTLVNQMFSQSRSLSIDIYMNPKLEAGVTFANLHDLSVTKEMFAIEFQLVHDLLQACTAIRRLRVEAASLHDYDEPKFVSLFNNTAHLNKLEHFHLCFRSSCKISFTFLTCLLDTCPGLEHVGSLVTWSVSTSDVSSVGRRWGKVAMFATRSHWSLPWRCEDGSLVEVTGQHPAHSGDLFDNF